MKQTNDGVPSKFAMTKSYQNVSIIISFFAVNKKLQSIYDKITAFIDENAASRTNGKKVS